MEALDLLLETTREPEPQDDAFVMRVMAEVRASETKRAGRRWMRRPMVFGISAAIVVTGGAVAAVVGTNTGSTDRIAATSRPTAVQVSDDPTRSSSDPLAAPAPGTGSGDPASTLTPNRTGYSSDHVAHTLDPATGVLLVTDTHTARFTRSVEHRVTVTVENTGKYPVAFQAEEGCGLQVVATAGTDVPGLPDGTVSDDTPWFEWECASSDNDPRLVAPAEAWVLAPGERKTADATLVLDQVGGWNVSGICRCTYRQVKPTPVPKTDPLDDITKGQLSKGALSVPLTTEQPDGSNLITPPIGNRVD
jgi:hypothetical protein